MRCIILSLLLILLIIPFVSAEIALDPLDSENYNYGDKVLVSGEISAVQDIPRVFLSFDLQCSNRSSQLFIKQLNLIAGKREAFSQLVSLPASVGGDCLIDVSLNKDGQIIESKKTSNFLVTSKLLASFQSETLQLQLGDKFILKGDISKLDASPFNGAAVLYFKQNGIIVLSDTLNVVDGELIYEKAMSLIPSGDYSLDVEVNDQYGNRYVFSDVLSLNIISSLNVLLNVERDLVNPGEQLNIQGSVRSNLDGKVLQGLELIYNFEGIKYVDIVNVTDFKFTYAVPNNIKSGEHTFNLIVQDVDGNYGDVSAKFNVRSIPTYMDLVLSESGEFVPEEDVLFEVKLLDQARDPAARDVLVSIFDSNGVFVTSKSIGTNVVETFDLPKYAVPGSWNVKAEGFGLMSLKEFIVSEYENLDVNLVSQVLTIANEGNILYEDNFVIHIGDEQINEKIKLMSNESVSLDLGRYVKTGEYNIIVPKVDKSFTNIQVNDGRPFFKKVGDSFSGITGSAIGDVSSGSIVGIILLIIIVLGTIIVLIKAKGAKEEPNRRGFSTPTYTYDKELALGKRRKEELNNEPQKVRKYNFGKATDADVKDFQKRILRKIEDDEKTRQRYAFQRPMQEQKYNSFFGGNTDSVDENKDKKKAMFSMFD